MRFARLNVIVTLASVAFVLREAASAKRGYLSCGYGRQRSEGIYPAVYPIGDEVPYRRKKQQRLTSGASILEGNGFPQQSFKEGTA